MTTKKRIIFICLALFTPIATLIIWSQYFFNDMVHISSIPKIDTKQLKLCPPDVVKAFLEALSSITAGNSSIVTMLKVLFIAVFLSGIFSAILVFFATRNKREHSN